jgi:dihydroxyacid dehydratase/phosphogluconate dehydratase
MAGHVAPEAARRADRGVRDGDIIVFDIAARRSTSSAAEEIAARWRRWPRPPRTRRRLRQVRTAGVLGRPGARSRA